MVYRLKYRHDDAVLESIVEAAVDFLSRWKPPVEMLVPAPPSNMARRNQPVLEVAKRISEKMSVSLCDMCVQKIKATGQMKDLDFSKRIEVLSDAYAVDAEAISGRRLLLFDDLYDSGATANMLTKALLGHGGAEAVYLLTLTQTR
jgi:competence protein ComFC